ncbi:alanine-glyoxylate transaminase / serine-glyoxylate transaminase / serine-pyruvate transaminase [Enhydrobacter aerosaccus]|uniref:Alanine-glyoxylate transaminase / serine-glyoxylate transaminase / serine-pyruvate transaminase n=1 Tax=Enhydrobacter aerosaccus TaxID=225324 RepID=A0A1T4T3A3_9HYPH|nr:aminotransferase class V-fold PLP-dependent enzyme [Enhydrobacter aerosaccus]SKA34751.1 alanine-glyoxylate transaminase / serine-glyoxylate transaminase / serine-pyruvate transaminase [Enhydrobacter aerosaccus]
MNASVNTKPRGRQFFNNPGPTNIPDRILRAMDRPVMDFMAPEFLEIQRACMAGVKRVLKTDQTLFAHASTGHGAWEAAVANLFSPGDTVLVVETGYFSLSWKEMAETLGIKVETVAADWRKGVDIAKVAERLSQDKAHEIKAILAVHNETATGLVLPLPEIRRALDDAKHPALLLSDTISSLGSMEYKMDAWGIDVTIGGSQKGLMLPTGMAITGVSAKAMEASRKSKLPKYYFSWELMEARKPQRFIGTVPVHFFFGLQESLKMLEEEGLDSVFARHARLAEATRAAVRAWGADGKGPTLYGQTPDRLSNSVTTVLMPEGVSSDGMRKAALERFNLSLGGGLGPLMGKVFRIGHMGDLNEPMLLGCLATTELAMKTAGVPFCPGGVDAAIQSLAG